MENMTWKCDNCNSWVRITLDRKLSDLCSVCREQLLKWLKKARTCQHCEGTGRTHSIKDAQGVKEHGKSTTAAAPQ